MPSAFGSVGSLCCAAIGLQLARKALNACRWSSSFQPAISAQATGAYWLPVISIGQTSRGYGRCGRAACAANGISDNAAAIAQRAAAKRPKPGALLGASRANQLPVRIARSDVAGKCPNIGDIGDLLRIAVDDRAGLVAGDRNHLRHKADRQLRRAIA